MNIFFCSRIRASMFVISCFFVSSCNSDGFDYMGCKWSIPSGFDLAVEESSLQQYEFYRTGELGSFENEGIAFFPQDFDSYDHRYVVSREIERCGYNIFEMTMNVRILEKDIQLDFVSIHKDGLVVMFIDTDYKAVFNSCLSSMKKSCD